MDTQPVVGIIMGSQSDWPTMRRAAELLDELGVAYETAHRLRAPHAGAALFLCQGGRGPGPEGHHRRGGRRGASAGHDGFADVSAGARRSGQSRALSGLDSLLSIVQMPSGIPVGTLAIGEAGAVNAGLLAAQILALSRCCSRPARAAHGGCAHTSAVAEEPSDAAG